MHLIVRQIIDRDCHVGLSNRAVMRHVISKLRNGWQTFRGMPKHDRRELLRQCAEAHKESRDLYRDVMYGGFGFVRINHEEQ